MDEDRLANSTLRLRVDDGDGGMVGFLDIPAEQIPEDDVSTIEWMKKLEAEVQQKWAIPIHLNIDYGRSKVSKYQETTKEKN